MFKYIFDKNLVPSLRKSCKIVNLFSSNKLFYIQRYYLCQKNIDIKEFISDKFSEIYSFSENGSLEESNSSIINLLSTLENYKQDKYEDIYEAIIIYVENLMKLDKHEEAIKFINEYLNSINYLPDIVKNRYNINLSDKLACLYGILQNYEIAESLLNQNIEILRKNIKNDTIDLKSDYICLAHSLYNKFNIYVDMNESIYKLDELLSEITKIYEKYPDDLKPIGVFIYNQAGNSQFQLDNPEEAIEYYQKALNIKKETSDEEDKESIDIIFSIALCYHKMERYNNAIEKLIYILDINKKNLKGIKLDNPDLKSEYFQIGRITEKLAECYFCIEEYTKCLENCNEARNSYIKFEDDPIYLTNVYLIMSNACFFKSHYEKSIEYAKKYIKLVDLYDEEALERLGMTKDSVSLEKYKCFKVIAESYKKLNFDDKCKKYVSICFNILKNNLFLQDTNDFIFKNLEYGRMYLLINEFEKASNSYDEIINFLEINPVEGKDLIVLDCIYKKTDILNIQGKLEECRILLDDMLNRIRNNNMNVEEIKIEEIESKLNNVNLKLKYSKNNK